MNLKFEILDHTADTGILAYGENLGKAFENTALGMFSLITELKNIKKDQIRKINVSATDRDNLLINWLNELIYLFDVDNLVFSNFDIIRLTDTTISATENKIIHIK